MKCKHMGTSGICYILSTADHFEYCVQGPCPHEAPMTNADRIRAMSDEELAKLIDEHCKCYTCPCYGKCTAKRCRDSLLEWLSRTAEEENENAGTQ